MEGYVSDGLLPETVRFCPVSDIIVWFGSLFRRERNGPFRGRSFYL